jgi:hypothetical protein
MKVVFRRVVGIVVDAVVVLSQLLVHSKYSFEDRYNLVYLAKTASFTPSF